LEFNLYQTNCPCAYALSLSHPPLSHTLLSLFPSPSLSLMCIWSIFLVHWKFGMCLFKRAIDHIKNAYLSCFTGIFYKFCIALTKLLQWLGRMVIRLGNQKELCTRTNAEIWFMLSPLEGNCLQLPQ
jgi:hypothetical protein